MNKEGIMEKCNCGYCKVGMSKSAEECVERMIAVSKRLQEWNKLAQGRKDGKNNTVSPRP